jgi:hypothetical protein
LEEKMAIRNLIEDIETFLSERDETVAAAAPAKRAAAKSKEARVQGLTGSDPRFKQLLDECVDATQTTIRGFEKLEEAGSEIAKEAAKVSGAADAEFALRRASALEKSVQSFSDAVSEAYADFARGREAMKAIASMAGISTTRKAAAGAAPAKKEPTNYAAMDASDLLSDVDRMSKSFGKSLRNTAELGSKALRFARDLKGTKLEGADFEAKIGEFVEAYLDFRDATSGSMFALSKGFSNRLNELLMRVKSASPGGGIAKVRAEAIDLSAFLEDEDFGPIVKAYLSEMAAPKRGVVKMPHGDRKIIKEACGGYAKKLNEMTSDAIDEAGCAYGMIEALYEMYGEPDPSYYGGEEPYVGVQESAPSRRRR